MRMSRQSRTIVVGLVALMAILLTQCAARRARALNPARQADLPISTVMSYADQFRATQNADGSYRLTANVQQHLKAEIGMALAASVSGREDYATSGRRDLDWVIANRLESNGGISWSGHDSPYFFEVHQHWFLIASELLRRQASGGTDLRPTQRSVWNYLTHTNPAGADFYYHDLRHHGVFFAYRSIDRQGHFQTQAPFKGSYEVGAALWSMALHQDSDWLNTHQDGDTTQPMSTYLDLLVRQSLREPDQRGLYDPEKGLWARSLLWNGVDWSGWEQHDFKYSLHMEEGALLYSLLTHRIDLLVPCRTEMAVLLSMVNADGSIRGMPDSHGDGCYEYGEAVSCFGLGARLFWGPSPDLGNRCMDAALRVAAFATRNNPPFADEGRAILLAGLCHVVEAQMYAVNVAQNGGEADSTGFAASPITLVAWPNPMSDHVQFLYTIPSNTTGLLRIVDATGRERAEIPVEPSVAGTGLVAWAGRDDESRRLPSGQYHAVLQSGPRRTIMAFAILR